MRLRDELNASSTRWKCCAGAGAAICLLTASLCCAQIQNQQDDGQWVMAPKNYASTRYSTLDQISRDNVRSLKSAFEFSTGTTHGNEAGESGRRSLRPPGQRR